MKYKKQIIEEQDDVRLTLDFEELYKKLEDKEKKERDKINRKWAEYLKPDDKNNRLWPTIKKYAGRYARENYPDDYLWDTFDDGVQEMGLYILDALLKYKAKRYYSFPTFFNNVYINNMFKNAKSKRHRDKRSIELNTDYVSPEKEETLRQIQRYREGNNE